MELILGFMMGGFLGIVLTALVIGGSKYDKK